MSAPRGLAWLRDRGVHRVVAELTQCGALAILAPITYVHQADPQQMYRMSKRTALALACIGAFAAGGASAGVGEAAAPWRDYARSAIAPDFDWAATPAAELPSARAASGFDPRTLAVRQLVDARSSGRALLLQSGERRLGFGRLGTLDTRLGVVASRERAIGDEFLSTALSSPVGDNGEFSVGAILARQRYASFWLGTSSWEAPYRLDPVVTGGLHETSVGGGVELGYRHALGQTLSFELGLQSRIEMEPFKSYRGVYSDPGDFDMPARIDLALAMPVGERARLRIGAERVFYSGIDAFTSAALPSRFLSLLGDGTSPVFAWQDLTVYSAEARVNDRSGGEWTLRYTTRQQPSPTSALLLRALEPDFTDLNLALGYGRDLGRAGRLWLAASYAPSQYFIGASPYVQSSLDGGSQVEFEAQWTIAF